MKTTADVQSPGAMSTAAEVLPGLDRFEVRAPLGSGGASVVYRAYDRERGAEVALKVLRRPSGRDLYRFKREFRALASLFHPNLVGLYELFAFGDQWCISMELIEGVGFIDWVRPARLSGARPRAEIVAAPVELARLRATLPQLVDGLAALHAAGKLHRDLKPSNVLVTPEGRVVLLDFGLVAAAREREPDRLAVGTPAYMSPEQAADQPQSWPSDWYAVGAMLYEALTGRRPFEGAAEQVMRRKQSERPAPPTQLVASTPADLGNLCMALLAAAPAQRPEVERIYSHLGTQPSPATREARRLFAPTPLVGRQAELDVLRRALADCRRHGVTVFVRAPSGMGKTALLRRFVEEVADRALLLDGRCHEREDVPFHTLDPIVDALAGALTGLPDDEASVVLPREVAPLTRLFPVLRRVPLLAERSGGPTPPDPQELRQRAFTALRQVLARLAKQRSVVVLIDDLHWGDLDSTAFLADLVHHPEPGLLLLFAHRPDDPAGVVAALVEPSVTGASRRGGDVRTISLGPLSDADARALAHSVAGDEARGDLVVAQAGGVPLLVAEMARANELDDAPSVQGLVGARARRLPPSAQALLVAVSVAAGPVPLVVAEQAAAIESGLTDAAALSSERLVRIGRVAGETVIEVAHDFVRVAVQGVLDASALVGWHEALARAFALERPGQYLERVASHWLAAGRPDEAAAVARVAADEAEQALAFRRAAELLALARTHGAWTRSELGELAQREAYALSCAGRLAQAADVYEQAAEHVDGDARVEVLRLRLEQLLRGGRLHDGLALSERVLAAVGVKLATGPGGIARHLGQRLGLRMRGLDFTPRDLATIPAPELRRVDVLYSVSSGLAFADPIQGRVAQNEFLRRALEVGEPFRVCLALGQEVAFRATTGTTADRDVEVVASRLKELARQVGHPHVLGITDASLGMAAFLAGRWGEARSYFEAGLRTFRDHGTGVRWETDLAEAYWLGAMVQLGELREVARVTPLLLRDAVERGDAFSQLILRSWRSNQAWLVLGRPDDAQEHAEAAVDPAQPAPALHFYYGLIARTQVDLYRRRGPDAWRRIDDAWPRLRREHVLRVQLIRVEATALRARAALAAAVGASGRGRAELLKITRGLADELIGEGAGWASGLGHLVRGLAAAADDPAAALLALAAADDALTAAGMAAWASAARLRRARLEGGATGLARGAAAIDALRDLGVVDPEAYAAMLAPELDA